MKTRVYLLVSALFLFWSFSETNAALVRYSYTGNHFDNFSDPSSYNTSHLVSGWFTLDIEGSYISLPYQNYGDEVEDFAFKDGIQGITMHNGDTLQLEFSTDINGDIDYWSVSASSPEMTGINTYWNGSLYSAGDFASLSLTNWGAKYASPGTWNKAIVPIPGAVWLLGTGLIGLLGIRRKF